MKPAPVDLGIIEGYFGKPWSWADRTAVMRLLAKNGYRFFHYAPKFDAFLRKRWQEPHPEGETEALQNFAAACRDVGVRFGVGLSPFEAYLDFDAETQAMLKAKLSALDDLGLDDLAILFDDMKGDVPDLAARQAEIMEFVTAHSRAAHFIMCPSYYSDDPVLDRAFGQRPPHYLEDLGRRLDSAIRIYWTGEEVCSKEYSAAHLDRVAQQLGRKPMLWDNYPVNDGARMSQFLHLRGFTGRPASLADHISGHAINPMLQPHLGCIPALTLAESYARGADYAYGAAFDVAARIVGGVDIAEMLRADLLALNETGLDRLGNRAEKLRARYTPLDHPAAREVIDWLDRGYDIDEAVVQTG